MVMQDPQRPEESVKFPRTRVIDDYELLCECWDLTPGLLQEHVLITAKSSLQALLIFVKNGKMGLTRWPSG